MKKVLLLFAAFSLAIAGNAQIRTHSSNDANFDGKVDISDVNHIISDICGSGKSQSVVSVDSLCTLLRKINPDIAKLVERKLGLNHDPDTPTDTHEYVDLGLPSGTLWATCNMGATSPEDYGLYFAWGETTGYTSDASDGHSFDWANYKWCDGSNTTMTKYCNDSKYGTVDNKLVLESADDAATANWGSEWQMPSFDQIVELFESSYVTTTWTTQNGVYGRLITSKTNGNSLFLPAAGYRENTSLSLAGEYGYYLTRELDEYVPSYIYDLNFYSDDIDWDCDSRHLGLSIRPVRVKESEPDPDPEPTPTDANLLPGKFSVSATKQVLFTKSNLYWNGSDFKFEANQTDTPTSWDPNHVGHFSWTYATDYKSGNAAYMPYAECTGEGGEPTEDEFWCGQNNPLTVEGTEGLYTLTGKSDGEWAYLFRSRTNASNLCKYGVTVTNNGKSHTGCLIIAPDDFEGTLQSSYTLDEVNAAGLVCLPASGFRDCTTFYETEWGHYWSATPNSYVSGLAFYMYFDPEWIGPAYNGYRGGGRCLRLVKNAEASEPEPDPEPEPTPTPTDANLLPGKFSVSATKQVQFTKGNLYWDGSSYKLEESQTAYPTKWDTNHVGHFFWTNLSSYNYGNQPYAESYSCHSGQNTTDKFWCGEDNPLTVEGTSGLYALTGGSSESDGEWNYLLRVRTNASNLYKHGVTVNGVKNCLVIAPDDYTGTISSYYSEDWADAESAGLVCFVPAGYRDGSSLLRAYNGYYWSATPYPDNSSQAYRMYFTSSSSGQGGNPEQRSYAQCIRLVHTVKL